MDMKSIWRGIIRRCHDERCGDFKYYGGRGIVVCERWRSSHKNFLADMGEPPPGTTLDRINVDLDYKPSNCRWATSAEQHANRQSHKRRWEWEFIQAHLPAGVRPELPYMGIKKMPEHNREKISLSQREFRERSNAKLVEMGLVPFQDCVDKLGLSASYVSKLVKRGDLDAVRLQYNVVGIRKDSLAAYAQFHSQSSRID